MTDEHRQGFEQLYTMYYARVYARVFALVHHREQAEDLTQETFLRVWRAWPPATQTNLYGWLYTIATNTVRDACKRASLLAFQSLDAQVWYLPAPAKIDPQARYEGAAGALSAMLDALTPEERYLLLLYSQYSGTELARRLGCNRHTLASRLSRLVRQAGRIYGEEVRHG